MAATLAGCVATQTPVARDAPARPGAGYIAGTFPRNPGEGFAMYFTNLDTGEEIAMAVGEMSLGKDLSDHVTAISVPPGRYCLADWGVFDGMTHQQYLRKSITDERVAAPFVVAAGHVAYIGHYDAEASTTGNPLVGTTEHWRMRPSPKPVAGSRQAFIAAYPALAPLEFECELCSDLPTTPTPRPRPAFAPAPARAGQPEGAIALTPELFDRRLWTLPNHAFMMFPNGVMDNTFQGRSRRDTYKIDNDRLCMGSDSGNACKAVVLRDNTLGLLYPATGKVEPLSVR